MKRGFFTMRRRGTAHVVVLCLSLFLFANVAAGQVLTPVPDASSPPPLKLVIAGGALYSTDIGLNALQDATTTVGVSLDGCQQGGIYLGPNGSRYLDDVTVTMFCGGRPDFYLRDAPTKLKAFTMISFHDGATRTSFKMPALGAVTPDSPSTIGTAETLTSTDHQQVYVLCGFPDSEGQLSVEVHGADAELLATEYVQCYAPITLQALKTKFQSGYVIVRSVGVGYGYFGCTYCDGGTVYGAIVNSTTTNGNARVYAFGQAAP
jgi:hypothetical protein